MTRCFTKAFFRSDFKTRDEPDGKKYIDGYFAVFNQRTELWHGCYEEIAPEAFDVSLEHNDIRCLFNHNTDVVLGRTGTKTLTLRTDAHGLYGSVLINENDKQALDIYARIQRGDINGCSFGFMPVREEYTETDNGIVSRLLETDTHEVSVCTFPAYPQTEIQARQQEFAHTQKQLRREQLKQIQKRLEELKC